MILKKENLGQILSVVVNMYMQSHEYEYNTLQY